MPKISAQDRQKATLCENLSFAGKESFKRLRTNILFSFPAGEAAGCKVIGVTSAHVSDGKSTTAINLAYSLAELGKRVLLVDADMRRPSVHTKLALQQVPGLSNLLVQENNVANLLQRYSSSKDSTVMDVIAAGEIPPNPAELLSAERMGTLVASLRERYDFVVVDMPPVGAVTDAQTVSRLTDGMMIVVREDNCPKDALAECIEQLRFAGAKILGFVLNGSHELSKGYGGKYGKYGYGKYGYSHYGYYK